MCDRTARSAALVLAVVGGVAPLPALAQSGGQAAVTAAEGEAPKKAEVTPPALTQFENAAYPPDAEKAGIQGSVVLKLQIDVEGNVTSAEVHEPAGHGFDESARAAALKFKFRPALREGKPVAATILYRYSFTLNPVAPPEPAAAAPAEGELHGVVRMRGTDEVLAGIQIVVTLPDGTERRALSDAEGRFEFLKLPPGQLKIRSVAPGFREFKADEEVVAGEATDVVYRVWPESTGIEIVVEGERPPREVTRRTIERREVDRIPGTSGDALRSLESLPGVARPPPFSGLLIVRGSAPEDTNYFFDGSMIPLAYHFGGLTSVIPTELRERIDFYPDNFSAR